MAAKHVRIRNVSIPDVEKPICPTHKRVMVYNNAKSYWNCTHAGCNKIARPVDEDTQLELDLPAITTDTLANKPLTMNKPLRPGKVWEAIANEHEVVVAGYAPANADGTPVDSDGLAQTREDLNKMIEAEVNSRISKRKRKHLDTETAYRIQITNFNKPHAQREFYIETEDGMQVDITPIIRDFIHENGASMVVFDTNCVDLQWD